MKLRKKYAFILFLIVFLLLGNEVFSQCAMCKAAAETSMKNDPSSMARSLNSGILYLLMMPYLLLCIIFRKQLVSLWKRIRNKDNKFATADQTPNKELK